jgi:hypothetical protein
MRRRLAQEDGSALLAAVVFITVILALGMGLLLFTDTEQKASAREQNGEAAFNVAEAALNAQVGQLSRVWPGVTSAEEAIVRCTSSVSTNTNYCPPATPMSVGYGSLGKAACPAGISADAWKSPITNQWTTYVRDDNASSTYFNSKNEETEPGYDANGDNKLWVRSVGVFNCRVVSLVTLVSRQEVSIPFPKDVLGGNWFAVTNKGGHGGEPIVRANGEGQTGEIGMRCEGITGTCEEFENGSKGNGTEQVEPYVKGPANPSPLLNAEQVASVRALAVSKGTLHSPALGNCPTTTAQLSGSPAYVEGCGNIQVTGGEANSSTNPGFLLMAEGTLTIKGNATFYGVIYARNPANLSTAVVNIGGASTVVGAIEVDGNGGIELGANSVNLVYSPKAIIELKGSAGATPTRNTFRVLPITQ